MTVLRALGFAIGGAVVMLALDTVFHFWARLLALACSSL